MQRLPPLQKKLNQKWKLRLNAGHAIPFIECWVIQHLEVVQFSILIQKLFFFAVFLNPAGNA
ncbi:hypothetical protein DMI82_11785 [Blautia sp. BCRC 81119]|nr:hypothetical protein DMI82_11785 [Blautia sp. BCRC 81119]